MKISSFLMKTCFFYLYWVKLYASPNLQWKVPEVTKKLIDSGKPNSKLNFWWTPCLCSPFKRLVIVSFDGGAFFW